MESPTPLLGEFDESYLELPDAVLTTVMRKHQRYLPVRDATGALLPMFVTVANGPVDVDAVRAGNEAVLRARLRGRRVLLPRRPATPLAVDAGPAVPADLHRQARLDGRPGRADRGAGAGAGRRLPRRRPATLDRPPRLVKFDLGSQLVTEMTSLAGMMARDYALDAGEPPAVAQALYEASCPGTPATTCRRAARRAAVAGRPPRLVAGLAATVGLPTGSSDPFAVRRAGLGLLAVHREHPPWPGSAWARGWPPRPGQPVAVRPRLEDAAAFLRAAWSSNSSRRASRSTRSARCWSTPTGRRTCRLLAELATLVGDDTFEAVVAAIQRARRIVPAGTPPGYEPALFTEPAEVALHEAVRSVLEQAPGDLTRFTRAARRSAPLAAFFDDVFVMADDPAVRATRLGLLATVRDLGAGLLDWSQLRL